MADSEEDEPLEPLHIPEIPNKVLWMQVTPDDTIWLSMDGYDAGYIYEYYISQTSEIPSRFLIICDGDDYPINNFIYSPDKRYLILAMEDGCLRVVKINQNDWHDLSDYWQISMHDNFNGFIPKMCFSYDEKYFFTCGYDGNVFSYIYNLHTRSSSLKIKTPIPLVKPVVAIEDTDGYSKLSLDEALIKAEQDRINKIANQNKSSYLEKIYGLKERFQEMLKKNLKLLSTQIVPRSTLELDPRITQDLEDRLQADLKLVKRKLDYEVEKSRVSMEKLKSHFTNVVDMFPIVVNSIKEDVSVGLTRQKKLSPYFYSILEIIEEKILEADRKMRPPERPPVIKPVTDQTKRKRKRLEYFLMGLSPSTIEKGLEPRFARALKRYRDRSKKLEERRDQWAAFNRLKPQQGVNDPEDEIALSIAISSIGDFKLKSATDYKVPPQLRESTLKKYKQLLHTRLRQFNLRHDFNALVLTLRDEKCNLQKCMTDLHLRLDQIQEELDPYLIRKGPPIPNITRDDFLENNLIFQLSLPQVKNLEKPISYVKTSRGDLLEKEVLLITKPITPLEPPAPPPMKGMPVKVISIMNDPEITALCEDMYTSWENEVRDYRLLRYLFEQNQIIHKMNAALEEFDQYVVKLSQKKLTVIRDGDLLDLYILTLNQELNILKKFESVENELQNKVNCRIEETLDMEEIIANLNNNIDSYKREIDHLQDEEKNIWQMFFTMVAENKFYDFLRRIFKKKYKPPKVYNPDESSSSSESSESSESEEDAASIDSHDFGIIKLDENVCPKGCDPNLYDKTFQLRAKRHGIELSIRDQKTNVEALTKELEMKRRKLKGIELLLKESQRELEAYQREKQKNLNLVECIIIVKLNQLQHLISGNQPSKVGDVLILSKHTLSKLYKRVGQLHNETMSAKSKHKSNIAHMTRMKTDCKHMIKQIGQIKSKTKELMIQKFGQHINVEEVEEVGIKTAIFGKVLNLDEIEENTMRKMVFEYRIAQENVDKLYKEEIATLIKKFDKKNGELAETLKLNTAKLDLLALLNKEKTELMKIIDNQSKKRQQKTETTVDIIRTHQSDINKLSAIVKKQRQEIQALTLEIDRLKTKGLLLQPRPPALLEPKKKEDDSLKSSSLDFVYTIPAKKPFRLTLNLPDVDLSVKSVISWDIKQMAKSIITNMVDSINNFSLSKFVKEDLIEQLVFDILQRPSVEEIVENLQVLIPDKLTDEQQTIINEAGEQIFLLRQAEERQSTFSATSLLNKVIDNNIEIGGSITQILSNILSELTIHLPIDFLLTDRSVHTILSKVRSQFQTHEIKKEELITTILSIRTKNTTEIQMLVDKILEIVYSTGIDYLYFIKQ